MVTPVLPRPKDMLMRAWLPWVALARLIAQVIMKQMLLGPACMRMLLVQHGFHWQWAHLDLLPALPDGESETCKLNCSVPGPFQTV